MALTERVEEDQIEIVGEFRQLQIRTATIIERDGVEVSREFRREVLTPDADVSARSDLVKSVAAAVWTPEVKTAWQGRPKPTLPT